MIERQGRLASEWAWLSEWWVDLLVGEHEWLNDQLSCGWVSERRAEWPVSEHEGGMMNQLADEWARTSGLRTWSPMAKHEWVDSKPSCCWMSMSGCQLHVPTSNIWWRRKISSIHLLLLFIKQEGRQFPRFTSSPRFSLQSHVEALR